MLSQHNQEIARKSPDASHVVGVRLVNFWQFLSCAACMSCDYLLAQYTLIFIKSLIE